MELKNMKVLTVGDVAKIMKTGRNKSYEIFNMKDFPSFTVGRLLRVTEADFIKWLDNQSKYDS